MSATPTVAPSATPSSISSSPGPAAAGDLDTSFSGNGWVRTLEVTEDSNNYLPEASEDVALQRDGKLVVAGELQDGTSDWYFGAFRYLPDGRLDPDFGRGGWVDTNIGEFEFPHAVALQRDGKIIVAGETDCRYAMCFGLVRYHTDGRLDHSFGGDGVVRTSFGQCGCAAYDVAVRGNGTIVAAGYRFRYGDHLDDELFAVARYLPDGRLDHSFSSNGKASVDFGFGDDVAHSVTLLPHGKVLVAGTGTRDLYVTADDFALARFDEHGTLDRRFSGDGRRTLDLGSARADGAYDVARQDDGGVVVVGVTSEGTGDQKLAVTRFHSDGSLDAGFGRRKIRPGRYGGYASAVALQGKRIVVAGRVFEDSQLDPSDWVMVRLLHGGARDTGWGDDGVVRTDFGTGADEARGLAVQEDGRIVAVGSIYGSQGIARYRSD